MNRFQRFLLKSAATITRIPINLSDPSAYYDHVGSQGSSPVSPRAALGTAAAWACNSLVSSTVGSTPLCTYRTNANGTLVEENGHSLYSVLHDSPNTDQTPIDVWEYGQSAIELRGNSYAEKVKGVNGSIIGLNPINPDIMSTTRRRRDGVLVYRWVDYDTNTERTLTEDDILHIRGPFGSPLSGVSTLAACNDSFNSAISASKAANRMFEQGMRPSGVLSTELPLDGPERAKLEKLLQEKHAGAMNAGTPLLLDNGVKYSQISLSASDAQMLESRRFSVEEICMIFGVPPHMIGYTTNSTSFGKGLTEQTHGFQKFRLRPRYKRIEQALNKQLLTARDRSLGVKIRFNMEALMRGVTSERSAFYESGLRNGYFTVNEVRAHENLPPVEGGDVARVQMQNVPLVEATTTNPDGGDDNVDN